MQNTCNLFLKAFAFESCLKRHFRKNHPGANPFPCQECDLEFSIKSEVENRNVSVHKVDEDSKVFSCILCQKTYPRYKRF